jgi:hypothetical protein
VQQWAGKQLKVQLPLLLKGVFLLVGSLDLQQFIEAPTPAQQQQQQQQRSLLGSSTSSNAVAAAAPWRLRQVSRVEVCPGVDPADTTVVLVGGERVRAGAVKQGQLAEAQDYQVGMADCEIMVCCSHVLC